LQHFVFVKKSFEKILKYFKILQILNVWLLHRSEISKRVFLEFEKEVEVHFVSHDDHFPFVNRYETQTLGIDRMVLAAGATLQFPG
jgi:type III pantothenate kinase